MRFLDRKKNNMIMDSSFESLSELSDSDNPGFKKGVSMTPEVHPNSSRIYEKSKN